MIAPKPVGRAGKVSLWRYWRLFRKDILSAQPEHLYRAWMAEFKTPFFRSYLVNQPDLVKTVLTERPVDFPKSSRVTAGLRPLLGQSVFVTNGETWAQQRRIIDPAFEGGRIKDSFASMLEAGLSSAKRLPEGRFDVEAMSSHVTADVIFRSLFSIPIDDELATKTYKAFRNFQRAQPIANVSALFPRLPGLHRKNVRRAAGSVRTRGSELVDARANAIADGTAPDDLATKIMTTADPETGHSFDRDEMIDQVAIFFLAGHETSAALLGWALWLLAAAPEWGAKVSEEAAAFHSKPTFANLSQMPITRNVLRETLRLYPPVPMFVREAVKDEVMRKRDVPRGSQIVVSPWHLHRHTRIWDDPDVFDPARWTTEAGRSQSRDAYIPFSTGPRVCPGAGFAMAEGAVILSCLMNDFSFDVLDTPVPVAHLTVRSKDGIFLNATRKSSGAS